MSHNITHKRSFVHAANKKRDSESDLMKKNRIKNILKKHFNLVALGLMGDFVYLRSKKTNEALVTSMFETDLTKEETFEQFQINKPDLFIKNHAPQRIIELDGEIHFLTWKGIEQTGERNDNYSTGGFTEESHTLIILDSLDLAKTDEELVKTLSDKLDLNPI